MRAINYARLFRYFSYVQVSSENSSFCVIDSAGTFQCCTPNEWRHCLLFIGMNSKPGRVGTGTRGRGRRAPWDGRCPRWIHERICCNMLWGGQAMYLYLTDCRQHVLECQVRQSGGTKCMKTLRWLRLHARLRWGSLQRSLRPPSWWRGGWLPHPQDHQPRSRPFGHRLSPLHSKISSDAAGFVPCFLCPSVPSPLGSGWGGGRPCS